MSLTVVSQGAKWLGLGSSITTSTFSLTAGDLLVVLLATQTNDTITAGTFSDTAGNTFHQAGFTLTTGNNHYSVWYAYNTSGNVSNAVTAAYTIGGYDNLAVYTVNSSVGPFVTTDPLDDAGHGTGSGTTITTSASLAVTGTQDFIVCLLEADSKGLAAGTGYTFTSDLPGGGVSYEGWEYHITSSGEIPSATCSNGAWNIVAASFKEPASGGGGGGGGGGGNPFLGYTRHGFSTPKSRKFSA